MLDSAVREMGSIRVHQGWEAVGLDIFDDHTALTVRPTGSTDARERRTVRARYVIGADGANSMVRTAIGAGMRDLGYVGDWLVCDFLHHDPDVDLGWANANQVLDPDRPMTAARWIGPRHSRLEFMLMPGEIREEMQTEGAA